MSLPVLPRARSDEHSQRERNLLVARLQSSDIFREYQRAFQSITGLPLALRPVGSFQAPMQGTRQANPLCSLMIRSNRTCAACLEVQRRLETAACERPRTLACFAGLNESAVPIRVGGNVVAYLQTGQVLFHKPSATETRKATRHAFELDHNMDHAEVESAYRHSHVTDHTQYEAMLRLLDIFAQQLSALSNQILIKQTQAESPRIIRARAFIAEHLTEPLSLRIVARAVGMSSFYFCKRFKRSTGLTFTGYLSRLRVEAVKQLLLNPHKRVSEAAFEAGFQSLSQFNRVFSHITGESPSAFRDRLHKPAPGHGNRHRPLVFAA